MGTYFYQWIMHAKTEWGTLTYFPSFMPWFSVCVQRSVYFFLSCTPTDYIMLLGIFKWRRHTALLTDGKSAYRAKVGRWHLGGKILKLASGVELVHLHSDINSIHTPVLLKTPLFKKSVNRNLKNLKLNLNNF